MPRRRARGNGRRGNRRPATTNINVAVPPLPPLRFRHVFRGNLTIASAAGVPYHQSYVYLDGALKGENKGFTEVFNMGTVHGAYNYLFNSGSGPVVLALHTVLKDGASGSLTAADILAIGNSTLVPQGGYAHLRWKAPVGCTVPTSGTDTIHQLYKIMAASVDGTKTVNVQLIFDVRATLYR